MSSVYDYIGAYRLDEENLKSYLQKIFPNPTFPITVQIGADNSTYTVCVPRALSQDERDYIDSDVRTRRRRQGR